MPIENFRGGGRGGGRGHWGGRGWRRPNYWNYGGWGYPGAYPYYFGPYYDQFYYDNLYNYPDTIYVNNLYNPLTNNPPTSGKNTPTPSIGGENSQQSWVDFIKTHPISVSVITLAFIIAISLILYSIYLKSKN